MKKNKWFTPLTVLLALVIIATLITIIPGFVTVFSYIASWMMKIGVNILLWVLGFAVPVFFGAWVALVWNHGEKHMILKVIYFLCGAVLAACVNIGIWAARVEANFPDYPIISENYFFLGAMTIIIFAFSYLIFWSVVSD